MIRKVLSLWFVLVSLGYAGLLLSVNQEVFHLTIPGVGEFRILSSLAMLGSYLFGVTLVSFYFVTAFMRQALELRALRKRLIPFESVHSSKADEERDL